MLKVKVINVDRTGKKITITDGVSQMVVTRDQLDLKIKEGAVED